MLIRLILAFALLIGLGAPARADDIAASARGVVRIVTIAVIDDEVVDFSHGSGFAVAPNRIVTNAHVVEAAARYPGNVIIGVVPSEGARAVQGRLIALDPDRDLALIEFDGVRLSPLVLFTGPIGEGEAVVALGYPGNVDLATARSARDFITPLSPVRSQGVLSGQRSLVGTQVLLHTASIARGNSGGPLLDRCGRVLGVNSALTRGEEGDSSFGIAVTEAELAAFLREAKQAVRTIGVPCVGAEEMLEQQREADDLANARAADAARATSERSAAERERRLDLARAEQQSVRENFIAAAALSLALAVLALGGAGLFFSRGAKVPAIVAAVVGGILLVTAILTFLLRPGHQAIAEPVRDPPTAAVARSTVAGPLSCTILTERSRITVSEAQDVRIDWRADGCMNGTTQYAETGQGWERVLVPTTDATVSVMRFDPAAATLTDSRYYLPSARLAEARRVRSAVSLKACSTDRVALDQLARDQAALRQTLPPRPNEWLTYRCTPTPGGEE